MSLRFELESDIPIDTLDNGNDFTTERRFQEQTVWTRSTEYRPRTYGYGVCVWAFNSLEINDRSQVRRGGGFEGENEVLASPVKTTSNSPSVNQSSSRERRRTRKVIAAKEFEENSIDRVVHNQPLFDTPTKVHKQNVLDSPSIENSQFKNLAREGSSHFSVEESSLDGSRSLTSQSDNRSYRDKLRDRFHAVKITKYSLNTGPLGHTIKLIEQAYIRRINTYSITNELPYKDPV
uniref:Uncharacterized protein n=1 Tax=Timema monikensis TaxID=170555 RepID=A0A7R9EAE4_9NEOP|nr:unnamed protein product [Timema monikensis]